MKKATVSAPGKLILLGEHAAVYDRPCIVTAVEHRMFVTLERLSESAFELEAPDVQVTGYTKPFARFGEGGIPKGAAFVERAVKNFSEQYPFDGGLRVTTKSEFSSSFGFGSSSASVVCVIKGLAALTDTKLDNKELFDLAYKTVLDIQGMGSGVDVAAALYGGTLYCVTGGKIIEPISVGTIPLVVGYTGMKADTVSVIKDVAEKAARYPEVVDAIYTEIGRLTDLAREEIQQQQWQRVGELMDFDQGMLEELGVSSQKLATMIHAARDAGAWGAKLSGAGIGDCMIALVAGDRRQAVSGAITSVGGQVIDMRTNVEGVKIEL